MNEHIQNFEQLMNNHQGVLPKLKEATFELQSLSSYNEFEKHIEQIHSIYYNLLDEVESILDVYRSFQFDEYRFNELQDLLFQVNRLKRKYGFTMASIQDYREELLQKINAIVYTILAFSSWLNTSYSQLPKPVYRFWFGGISCNNFFTIAFFSYLLGYLFITKPSLVYFIEHIQDFTFNIYKSTE